MEFSPLSGVRVVDFTWNLAGPLSTKVLASLGADVMKVEWPERPDPSRFFAFSPIEEGVLDSSGFFAFSNVGKRSVTANPATPEGLALIERLIAASDVVTESYSARVLRSWGLTYERMRELNPRVIYLSVTGFGHTGPHREYVSYGPTAQAASGITATSGIPGRPPSGWGFSYLDVMTGYQAAFAVTAALHRQRETGAGARIDLSQVEVGAASLGPVLLDIALNGTPDEKGFPPGNRARWPGSTADGHRYEVGAPYNLYPTADGGNEAYCAISVRTDDEWRRLVSCMGHPGWADEPRFADVDARVDHQDDLDRHIAGWTRRFPRYELMDLLQRAGVPCGTVQSGRDRLENDPALRAREVFQSLDHPAVGRHRFEAFPVHIDGEALPLRDFFPIIGQHTDRILTEVAGLTADEVRDLAERGVTWPPGRPKPDPDPGAPATARVNGRDDEGDSRD
jgi:crotonobetainyl-CoA:carnitine CoA-transferase CaiB-like acyl-CoA transferase